MQTCMNARRDRVEELKHRLKTLEVYEPISRIEISRITGIHESQVSRICRGQFQRITEHVLLVCNHLGIEVPRLDLPDEDIDPSWERIETSARAIWDNTPEGALKIAKVLDSIGQLRT